MLVAARHQIKPAYKAGYFFGRFMDDPIESVALIAVENFAQATKGLGKTSDEFAQAIADVYVKTKQYIANPPVKQDETSNS